MDSLQIHDLDVVLDLII